MITGSTLVNYTVGLNAFLAGTDKKYIDDVIEYKDNSHSYAPENYQAAGHWVPADGHQYYWPKANNLDFWAWAPYEAFSSEYVGITNFSIADNVLSFTYDLKESDATQQPDLMFANVNGQAQTETGCVPLPFKHALAAVQFKVIANKKYTVASVSLVDVAKTGDCTFNGSFAWTPGENKATYSYDFDEDLLYNASSKQYTADLSGSTQEATFMMIPQTLKTQKISIVLTIGDQQKTYSGLIPEGAWEAGKTYVYTIAVDEVNVNITDEVTDNNVKDNVVITNSGSSKAYLRAAIVANWVDDKGKIIHHEWDGTGTWMVKEKGSTSATQVTSNYFTPRDQISGDLATTVGTGWVRGNDGYYYYQYQVPAGQATIGTLFDSYTPAALSQTDVAAKNAHLEMSIAVQAIDAKMLYKDGAFVTTYGWDTTNLTTSVDAQ